MVTREQLENSLENKKPFSLEKGIDHDFRVISLLRERIPYSEVNSIICGADHDTVFLCNVEEAIPFLLEEDLAILADCNCCIDEYDHLFLFV